MMEEQKNESPNELETLVVEELARSFDVGGKYVTVRMNEEQVVTCIDGECRDMGEGKGLFDALLELLSTITTRDDNDGESEESS